jgi:hypothetical protein
MSNRRTQHVIKNGPATPWRAGQAKRKHSARCPNIDEDNEDKKIKR